MPLDDQNTAFKISEWQPAVTEGPLLILSVEALNSKELGEAAESYSNWGNKGHDKSR